VPVVRFSSVCARRRSVLLLCFGRAFRGLLSLTPSPFSYIHTNTSNLAKNTLRHFQLPPSPSTTMPPQAPAPALPRRPAIKLSIALKIMLWASPPPSSSYLMPILTPPSYPLLHDTLSRLGARARKSLRVRALRC